MPPTGPEGERVGEGVALGSAYVLHELVGRGAMGQVYRASRRIDGLQLAVKLLRPELASDPGMVARFLQERTFLASLHHPHLVTVRDLVAEGETLAIVMDFVAGVDLRQYLSRRGVLPPLEAIGLMVQVLDGLGAVHAAGIVHRDLKPGNVLVDLTDPAVPIARITDFGVARVTVGAGLTLRPEAIGTLEYMAPELASGEAGPATDLYAAGVMLYELLWGRPPFRRDNLAAMVRAHLEDAPERPEGVPDSLWELLVVLMAKAPDRRPRSAGDARSRLVELSPALRSLPAWPPPEAVPGLARGSGDRASGGGESGGEEGPTVVKAPITPALPRPEDEGVEAGEGATRLPSRRRDQAPSGGAPGVAPVARGSSSSNVPDPRRSTAARSPRSDRRSIYLIGGGAAAVLLAGVLVIGALARGGASPPDDETRSAAGTEITGPTRPEVTGPRAKLSFARLPGGLSRGNRVFVVISPQDGFEASDVPATVVEVDPDGAGGTVDLEFESLVLAKRLANERGLGLVLAPVEATTTTTAVTQPAVTQPAVTPSSQGPPGS